MQGHFNIPDNDLEDKSAKDDDDNDDDDDELFL